MNSNSQLVAENKNKADEHSLKKELTVFDSICIVVGSVVGSGIFVSPTRVFELLNESALFSLIAWICAALISIAGALCYAELGCLFPRAGAEYQYLKNGIGKFWGFIFSWTQLTVLGTGSIAIMAIISANYLVQVLFPGTLEEDLYTKMAASLLIAILTIANCFGVKSGSLVQNVLTIAKVAGIGFLILLGVYYFPELNFGNLFSSGNASIENFNFFETAFHFGSAMIACLWAYDGWNNLSRVTEESINVSKSLPIGLIMGILITSIIYLCLNCFYFSALSPEEIVGNKAIAISAVTSLGDSAGWLNSLGVFVLLGLLISLSAGGATNGSLLSGARIYFAAARDGLFFKSFSKLDPKSKAPISSLLIQGIWAIALVWIGKNFETLLDYFSFSAWLFYAASAGVLIYLRMTKPNIFRPYKVLLYPLTPIVFLFGASFLVLSQIVNSPIPSLWSLVGVFSGSVFYFLLFRKVQREN
ncbi:MAG: amino acid permease [Candidatus Caenarcaniphilales bacterium]|nr:amino acid permease [Candidatus Caenarcaniphilales bacterium]